MPQAAAGPLVTPTNPIFSVGFSASAPVAVSADKAAAATADFRTVLRFMIFSSVELHPARRALDCRSHIALAGCRKKTIVNNVCQRFCDDRRQLMVFPLTRLGCRVLFKHTEIKR